MPRTMHSLGPRPVLARLAALVATGLLVAGCGDDPGATSTDSQASDPASAGPSSPSSPSDVGSSAVPAPAPSEVVAILTSTAAGGSVATGPATELSDAAAVEAFGQQFRTPEPIEKVNEVIGRTDVPADWALYAAVVAIGCDPPTGVDVTRTGEGLVITARPVKSQVQCFAPVTSVALVLAPDA